MIDSIYIQAYDVFFANLREYQKNFEFPVKKYQLFSFYEELEENFLMKNNTIDTNIFNLITIMLWSIYRVWANHIYANQSLCFSLSNDEKLQVISLFIENLDNEEGHELLGKINIVFDDFVRFYSNNLK